jgi:hypothetical protein
MDGKIDDDDIDDDDIDDDIEQDDIRATIDSHVGLPLGFPFLVRIRIDPQDWFRFQNLADDNPNTLIVGHDVRKDGQMIVRVACSSPVVRYELEKGWPR